MSIQNISNKEFILYFLDICCISVNKEETNFTFHSIVWYPFVMYKRRNEKIVAHPRRKKKRISRKILQKSCKLRRIFYKEMHTESATGFFKKNITCHFCKCMFILRESCKMVGDFPQILGGCLAKSCRNLGLSCKILKNLAEICSNTWQTLLYKFFTHVQIYERFYGPCIYSYLNKILRDYKARK